MIEQFSALKPEKKNPPSNMLDASDASSELKQQISQAFVSSLVDNEGRIIAGRHEGSGETRAPVRLIEKTPKNVLRIPFFNKLFPDALFIYLYRNPLENISSIIDGWRSGNFVTYPGLRVSAGPWSFLLPPGWESRKQDKVESLAAWQWVVSHEFALEALSGIERNRVFALNYGQFLEDSAQTVSRLCSFMGIDYDQDLADYCAQPLPLSRYTLSKPELDKWRKNAAELAGVIQETGPIVARINRFAGTQSTPLKVAWSKASLAGITQHQQAKTAKVSRNEPCPCGSGKKYKRCHGALASVRD